MHFNYRQLFGGKRCAGHMEKAKGSNRRKSLLRLGHLKKSSHFFARSVPQEKRQKSGLTDKKVDLNGQKKYPNGTKIVRWFHYFCPLVQFWFLFQAGTFFPLFWGVRGTFFQVT